MSSSGSGPKRRWSFSVPAERALTELGPYEIRGTLGKGNQGEVYRAFDPTLGREVALKVLRARTTTAQARFQREAEATAALDHPGIVRIHASGQEGGLSYVVYELIEGAKTLEDAFQEGPPPAQVGAWILAAARALGAAHAAGIVHRDLKPSNLLLDAEGNLRVADFGLAQTAEGASLTASHASVGTPLYMSPEQIYGGGETGPPADVWGLGVVLYEGLCGELPFQATTLGALAGQVLQGELTPPRVSAPKTPRALEAVCLRCLQRAPGDRYPDGAALATSLEDALRAGDQVQRSWLVPAALGALITLLVGVALAKLLPPPSHSGVPSSGSRAPADPQAFMSALRGRTWDRAEELAARARDPDLWRLRLAAERAATPSELQTRFEAAFAQPLRGSTRAGAIAALCSTRAAFFRGEQVLAALRSPAQSPPRWHQVAQAEVLLCAGRPHEARDALANLDAPPASAEDPVLTWCDEGALRTILDALCSGGDAQADWSALPQPWREAGARWLRAEARHLLEWVLRAEEHPHLARPGQDPGPRARALLARAALLSTDVEHPVLLALVEPLSLAEAEALPTQLPEGSTAAQAARRGVAQALATAKPSEDDLRRWLTILERVQRATAPEHDPWGVRARDRGAQAWVEGRVALALGEVERAQAAFERADPLGHHPGVAADALRVAERSGDAAALERARERLKRLQGSRREEAREQVRALRSRYREGPAPAALLEATLALDPLNPDSDFARVVAEFQLGRGAAEDLIRVSERWLSYECDLHRQFYERCLSSPITARLGRTMLPHLRQRATPLGRWILDGLEGEAAGISPEEARALLDRAPDRRAAPGALAPRLTRAFLAIRGGSLGCAEAELNWVLRIAPRHGLARFYRALLLAKRGARPERLRLELAAAIKEGFRSQRILTWSPGAYPELRAYPSNAESPLGRALRAGGWKARK